MIEWITHLWTSLTWQNALLGVGMFVVSFTVSLALVSFVLVKLPSNYFHSSHARQFWVGRHRAVRWSGLVLKNFAGLVLIVLGVIMSLPGVPGQGILTILLGLIMLDIPGKRPLETRLVKQPKVLQSINRLRERFDKPPLILD
nr:sodium:dicarboxylate symporter family [uncultured bacterium]ALS88839.1 sodium:dicarboxylate symporter family [uncultured bacterium]